MSLPIFDLLKTFRGLDPLKKLLWSELQYERVNQILGLNTARPDQVLRTCVL